MDSRQKKARVAGLLYLFIVVTGIFSLLYVPRRIIVRGDATATAANILAHEGLFRFGIVNSVMSTILFLFVALALYRLLADVHRGLATVMVILVAIQIPFGLADQANQLGALILVRPAEFLAPFTKLQRDALAMLLIEISAKATFVIEMFWGLWLLPLALLIWRSTFLPRFLGVWLSINGLGYMALSVVALLAPERYGLLLRLAFPVLLGELALTLWLLVRGARPLAASIGR
ncbi:MAG TPA: DUF4386 domain-containing protein [Gemmatimonadaceae bacterium]|nr:DUF4386 domain-containing protein [Gemmatimonadaceae bacterium]